MDPLAGAVSHAHAHDMSFVGMILSADVVVQGVMVLLVALSLACWTIIFDRFLGLRAAARQASAFRAFSQGRAAHAPSGVGAAVLAAGEAAGHGIPACRSAARRGACARSGARRTGRCRGAGV
jgi:biopolymer transport protein TolQ